MPDPQHKLGTRHLHGCTCDVCTLSRQHRETQPRFEVRFSTENHDYPIWDTVALQIVGRADLRGHANLFAAAPELLEALIEIRDALINRDRQLPNVKALIRTTEVAIAKAEFRDA